MLILTFVIRDEVFRSVGRIFFAICCLIAIIAYDVECKNKQFEESFKNSKSNIIIVTRNRSSKKISYFEMNDNGDIRETSKIEYEKIDTLHLEDCFESYVDHNKRKVLNKFKEESCKVYKSNPKNEYDEKIVKDILMLTSKLEHDIYLSKILIVNGNYYVNVLLNVNIWDPYKLYKYENGNLKLLYTFDNEEVIYIEEIKK